MYSFTRPNKKPLFKEDTKLWLVFIAISTSLYLLFSIFLLIKIFLFKKDIKNYSSQTAILSKKIEDIKKEKKFILKQKEFYLNIIVSNSLKKESIKNLLDLIPDPITIDKIDFEKNRLIIYGTTPIKDIYNMLLRPPLESIFSVTKVYFYQMPNGWYKFKSENILKEQ